MNWAFWERIAPLDGIIAVAFWVAGVVVMSVVADQPSIDASSAEALAYFKGHSGAIQLGGFLFALGALFFIWFLGSLRIALRTAEGGEARVTGIVFAGGVAVAVLALLLPSGWTAGAVTTSNLTAEAAQALLAIFVGVFFALELAAAVFVLAVAALIFQTRVFPAWLGWFGLLVSIGLLIVPIGWLVLLFLFPVWLAATSLVLYGRGAPAVPASKGGLQ